MTIDDGYLARLVHEGAFLAACDHAEQVLADPNATDREKIDALCPALRLGGEDAARTAFRELYGEEFDA